MGGAPCRKLLLNSGSVIGILTGIQNVVVKDGNELPYDLIEEGESLICGFHERLAEYEKKLLSTIKS